MNHGNNTYCSDQSSAPSSDNNNGVWNYRWAAEDNADISQFRFGLFFNV